MTMTTPCGATVVALAGMLVPSLVSAQATTPKVLLEKSATFALDKQYKSYRVPTISSNGSIKYYDVTVTLTVAADGKIGTSAAVVSALSPNVTIATVPPGSYKSPAGTTCRNANVQLSNGRTQSSLSCTDSNGTHQISVANGSVVAGHPYFPQLQKAGIDTLADANTSAWGIVNNNSPNFTSIDNCSSFGVGNVVSVKTNGSEIIVSAFGSGNFARCGFSLVKQ